MVFQLFLISKILSVKQAPRTQTLQKVGVKINDVSKAFTGRSPPLKKKEVKQKALERREKFLHFLVAAWAYQEIVYQQLESSYS
jgi:hypothetical protein